jgi:hypothetical protein
MPDPRTPASPGETSRSVDVTLDPLPSVTLGPPVPSPNATTGRETLVGDLPIRPPLAGSAGIIGPYAVSIPPLGVGQRLGEGLAFPSRIPAPHMVTPNPPSRGRRGGGGVSASRTSRRMRATKVGGILVRCRILKPILSHVHIASALLFAYFLFSIAISRGVSWVCLFFPVNLFLAGLSVTTPSS